MVQIPCPTIVVAEASRGGPFRGTHFGTDFACILVLHPGRLPALPKQAELLQKVQIEVVYTKHWVGALGQELKPTWLT